MKYGRVREKGEGMREGEQKERKRKGERRKKNVEEEVRRAGRGGGRERSVLSPSL